MTKAFIYASGDGFPRQIETCQRFIDSKGWYTARTFSDCQTGPDREILSMAMRLSGGAMDIKTIVIEREDRLSTDLVVSEIFLRECRNKNIAVFVADSGEELVNSEDPTRILIRQIMGSLERWEKGIASRKLQAGRRAKAERTGKFGGGGPPVDKYGNRGSVSQKNLERRIIGTIIHRSKEGENFSVIARYLTSRRIQIPNPKFVHRKDAVARSPFFWTYEIVRGLHNEWANTGTIVPFIGDNL